MSINHVKIRQSIKYWLDTHRDCYPPLPAHRIRDAHFDRALARAISNAIDIALEDHIKVEHAKAPAEPVNLCAPAEPVNLCAPAVPPPPPVPVPEVQAFHRANPDTRRWETSYTKKVIDNAKYLAAGIPRLTACLNLLADYWHTQHEVYEQRDWERTRAQALRSQLHDQAETIKQMQEELGKANAKLRGSGYFFL